MASSTPAGSSESTENIAQKKSFPLDDGGPIDTVGLLSNIPNTVLQENETDKTFSRSGGEDPSICKFYLSGRCRFGQRCRLLHSLPTSEDPEVQHAKLGKVCDGEMDEKVGKTGRKDEKNREPEMEGKEPLKKSRMRTADDVISRILWDPSLDPAHFVVGYLDRFLGVLERPFSEFSWDTNICDCDYTDEMALPRHRIQYFNYQDRRVWDRTTRTDKIFGSTGHRLSPPFGDEVPETDSGKDVQEPGMASQETGEEIAVGERNRSSPKSIADPTRGEEGDSEVAVPQHDGVEKTAGQTSETQQEAESEAGARGEDGAVREPPPLSSNNEEVGKEEHDWMEWKGEEGMEHLAWTLSPDKPQEERQSQHGPDANRGPSPPKEQRGRPGKRRPTHFVAIRADTPAIFTSFQHLQEEVTALLPLSAPHWLSSPTLHITLCLLVLSEPSEVSQAEQILQSFARDHRHPLPSVSFPPRLKHFNGRVLYLAPQPLPEIQRLNGFLQEAFQEKGLLHPHSKAPRYHLTLAKAPGATGAAPLFDDAGAIRLSKRVNLGKLVVNKLYLCTIGGEKREDGFYHTICEVKLY